jgi:hypothetical protein
MNGNLFITWFLFVVRYHIAVSILTDMSNPEHLMKLLFNLAVMLVSPDASGPCTGPHPLISHNRFRK